MNNGTFYQSYHLTYFHTAQKFSLRRFKQRCSKGSFSVSIFSVSFNSKLLLKVRKTYLLRSSKFWIQKGIFGQSNIATEECNNLFVVTARRLHLSSKILSSLKSTDSSGTQNRILVYAALRYVPLVSVFLIVIFNCKW